MHRGLLVLGVLAACERGDATPAPPIARPAIESGLPDIPCPSAEYSVTGFLIASLIPPPEGAMAIEYEPNRLVWMLASLFGPPEPCNGQCCVALRWTL
jgi:hypothetical protein